MQKMDEDLRADANAVVEAAVGAERSAREDADTSLDKRLEAVTLDLRAVAEALRTELEQESRTRTASSQAIMAGLESAIRESKADLDEAEGRLGAALSEAGERITAEAKERSTEAAAFAAGLASVRADADAEAKARDREDHRLMETIAALAATVERNEGKLAEGLQHEKQARLSLDKDLRAWTGQIVEDERKERSDADTQEMEARVLLKKVLCAFTDEHVARSEAAQNATTAALNELASSHQEVQATVTSLEKGLETQEFTAIAFTQEVQTTLVDMKSRIAGAEDAFQKLQKTTLEQTVSMSKLQNFVGLGTSYTIPDSVGTRQHWRPPQSLSFGGYASVPLPPSTIPTTALLSQQIGARRAVSPPTVRAADSRSPAPSESRLGRSPALVRFSVDEG
jgi:hypothetical protein